LAKSLCEFLIQSLGLGYTESVYAKKLVAYERGGDNPLLVNWIDNIKDAESNRDKSNLAKFGVGQ
jgi:hypothetical protein